MVRQSVGKRVVFRTVVAFTVFALVAGGSVGVFGVVYAEDEVVTGTPAELDVLELPPMRVGDKWTYVADGPLSWEQNETTPWWAQYEWMPPGISFDESGGSHRVNVLREAVRPESDDLDWQETAYDQSTGFAVGIRATTMDSSASDDAPLILPEVEFDVAFVWEFPFPFYDEVASTSVDACTVPSFTGGPVKAGGTFRVDACAMGIGRFEQAEFQWVQAVEVEGRTYVLFDRIQGSDEDGVPSRLVFRTDLPYPYEISRQTFVDDEEAAGMSIRRLGAYEPGGSPLPRGPYEALPSIALPIDRAVGAVGLDEQGIDHPFPFQEAFDAAVDDPDDSSLQIFLDTHPGWFVFDANLDVDRSEDEATWEWTWTVTDGQEAVAACWSRAAPENGPVPMTVDPLLQRVSTAVNGRQCGDATTGSDLVRPLGLMGPSAPSILASWEMFRTARGIDDDPPFYRVVYDTCDCPPTFEVGTSVYTGSGPPIPSSPVAPGSQNQGFWTTLTFGADGKLQNSITWAYAIGLVIQPVESGNEPAGDSMVAAVESHNWAFPPAEVAAAALILAFIIAALYWCFPWLKHVVGLGLFSRVERHAALDNNSRARIMAAIEAEPGIHDRELQRRSGTARGALQHHLDKLVSTSLVERHAAAGFTGYWPAGQADRLAGARAAALRSPLAKSVHEALQQEPGLSATALASRLGASRQAVAAHMKRLREAGALPNAAS